MALPLTNYFCTMEFMSVAIFITILHAIANCQKLIFNKGQNTFSEKLRLLDAMPRDDIDN